jgi:hypothetical protein
VLADFWSCYGVVCRLGGCTTSGEPRKKLSGRGESAGLNPSGGGDINYAFPGIGVTTFRLCHDVAE